MSDKRMELTLADMKLPRGRLLVMEMNGKENKQIEIEKRELDKDNDATQKAAT